jgi:hypothetical protein
MTGLSFGVSVFVDGDDGFTFILAAFGAGVVGKLGFAAFRAGSHDRGVDLFVGTAFVPF